jgi:hypothetical protein
VIHQSASFVSHAFHIWVVSYHVVSEQSVHSKISGEKGAVTVAAEHKSQEDHADPCAIGLEITIVRHSPAVNTLSLGGTVEEEVSDTDHNVVDDLRTCDDIDEPGEHLGRSSIDVQEAKEGEADGDKKAVERHALLSALLQELRCLTFEGKTVKRAGSVVSVGVSSGEDRRAQKCVDEMRKTADAQVSVRQSAKLESQCAFSFVPHSDNVRGRSSAATTAGITSQNVEQRLLVVGNHDTNAESAADEEECEASISDLECVLEIRSGKLDLARKHRQVLRPNDGKCRGPQAAEEPLKSTKITRSIVFGKGTGIVPIAKAVCVLDGVATNHCDEGKGEDNQDQEDLAKGEPELGLSVCLHDERIDGEV